MKQVNWKCPTEMNEVLDFLVFLESEPGKPGNKSEILRRIVAKSKEYKAAKKQLAEQMANAA